MIKAIIFDCWGTLFTNNQSPHPFETFANKIGHTISDRIFLKQFEEHLMRDIYDDLRIPVRALLDNLGITNDEKLVEELRDILLGSIATQTAYPDTINHLKKLKKNYDLILLTNTFKQGFDGLQRQLDIDSLFNNVITSYETHHIKPEAECFQMAVASSGGELSEIVVVGDNLHDDIEPSRSLGLKAILLDRKGRYPDYQERITSMAEIQTIIELIDQN